MAYRVVHCGTGSIGAAALRAILQQPDLELVGHFVSAPDKAGRDSGELVGAAPVGVTATNDWSEVLDLGADCLTYFGNSIGREREAIADLVPFLERGTNVVTFSGDPSFTVEMNFGKGGQILSGMPAVNCVPAVCEAKPGLLGPLDVPRYWARNVAARTS